MNEVLRKGKLAKEASYLLQTLTSKQKNEALYNIAQQILLDEAIIINVNKDNLQKGKQLGLSDSILDRITLNSERIKAMSEAIMQIIELDDPIGETLQTIKKDNGLLINKVRVPIGVIGMIYEARPNVTLDAAALAIKTGNAVLLRGSSSALSSNKALILSIHKALQPTIVPNHAVQLIEDTSRETARELFQLNQYLDVLIPRGGKQLIDSVMKESTVPVIETGAGNCHMYIDEEADLNMVEELVINGKTQRPSVCNAVESLLIHNTWFEQYGKQLLSKLTFHEVDIYGDETVRSFYNKAKLATEEDWGTEYLELKISVKIVESLSEAIEHINQYGTRHSEAIITENKENAHVFLNRVDAASVYHNASTRFTDGFEFGFGAEMGISTQKLHVRGPMGLEALTSSKYLISGDGQIRN